MYITTTYIITKILQPLAILLPACSQDQWLLSLSFIRLTLAVRNCNGEGNGNPLQCSCLENPRDAGA